MKRKKSEMIGDWPSENFFSLLDLLGEIRRRKSPVNALYALSLVGAEKWQADALAEDVSGDSMKLLSHPLGAKVSKDRRWIALRDAFLANRRRAGRPLYPRHEFSLMYLATFGVAMYEHWEPQWTRSGPVSLTYEQRASAVRAIKRLLTLQRQGARFASPVDNKTLADLLAKLRAEIEGVERKAHHHKKARESETVRAFARSALDEFEDISSTVLRRFAEFASISLEDKAIETILRNVRAERSARRASAQYPPN